MPPPFELLYGGDLGGKARGLLRTARMLHAGEDLAGGNTPFVSIPPSAVIGTDLFDEVVALNRLGDLVREGPPEGDEKAVYRAFLGARLPGGARERLRAWLRGHRVPLAVRSSSVQEDNPLYSFSGIYRTNFVANAGPIEERARDLERAVRIVLGSTCLPRAYAYRRRHDIRSEDERMAVLVQHVVGRRRGGLFFPLVAGVGFSKNMYPWNDRISVDDGVVRLVYGLGTRAVGREYARVFVPSQPSLRPEGFSVEAIEQYAQDRFDAVDLQSRTFRQGIPLRDVIGTEGNGLGLVSSLVREGDFLRTPRWPLTVDDRFVLTFDEIIAGRTSLPLVPILRSLFESLSAALGTAVDLEFACPGVAEEGGAAPTLAILQVRPLGVREQNRLVRVDPGSGRVVLRSHRVMGNGEIEGIRHAVLVLEEDYRRARPEASVLEIRRLDRALEGRPYLLIGPGRWGTTNPALGVPAVYEAICGCAALVEVAEGAMAPEVSYGTHFFGDLLSSGTFYMALLPREGDVFDRGFLLRHASAPANGVRLVEFPDPLTLQVDGQSREGVAFCPGLGTLSQPGKGDARGGRGKKG